MRIGWIRAGDEVRTLDEEKAIFMPDTDCGSTFGVVIAKRDDGKYYVAPDNIGAADAGERVGPFRLLKDAKAVAETMIRLNGAPPNWRPGLK